MYKRQDMYKAGKINNKRKTLDRYKSVFGFAIGSPDLYDWIRENPGVVTYPISYCNDPSIVGKIDNFVSINNCISVDLYGQICAESAGTRQISGTGGQLDFLESAAVSKGGKAFICMTSSFTNKMCIRDRATASSTGITRASLKKAAWSTILERFPRPRA